MLQACFDNFSILNNLRPVYDGINNVLDNIPRMTYYVSLINYSSCKLRIIYWYKMKLTQICRFQGGLHVCNGFPVLQ